MLAASRHLLLHAASLLVPLLLAVWIFAANSFARGPPPQARECAQEWVAGAGAGGCLSTLPSAPGSLWAAVAASLGDPDGHTSSVCWLPPTPLWLCQGDPLLALPPGLPHRYRWQEEEAPGTQQPPEHPAKCGPSNAPSPDTKPLPPHSPPLFGVPTQVSALEKEFFSVMCWPTQEEPGSI